MLLNRVWHVVCVLCCVCVLVCVNAEEYEVNYADNYENEITQDQQDGTSLSFTPSFLPLFFCLSVSLLDLLPLFSLCFT